MKTDLTNLMHLRQTALAAQGLTAEVAAAAAEAIEEVAAGSVSKEGGTMSGSLVVLDPVENGNPATKKYVDDLVGDIGTILDAINGEVV